MNSLYVIWLPFHWYWCRTVGNRIYYYPTLSAENFRCSWRSNYATLGISIDMPVYLCILTMTYLKDSISHLLVWVHATRPRGPRDHQSGLRSCFIKAGQAGRGEFICYLLSDMVTNSRTLLDLNENRHTWCHDGGPAKCRFLGNLNKACGRNQRFARTTNRAISSRWHCCRQQHHGQVRWLREVPLGYVIHSYDKPIISQNHASTIDILRMRANLPNFVSDPFLEWGNEGDTHELRPKTQPLLMIHIPAMRCFA